MVTLTPSASRLIIELPDPPMCGLQQESFFWGGREEPPSPPGTPPSPLSPSFLLPLQLSSSYEEPAPSKKLPAYPLTAGEASGRRKGGREGGSGRLSGKRAGGVRRDERVEGESEAAGWLEGCHVASCRESTSAYDSSAVVPRLVIVVPPESDQCRLTLSISCKLSDSFPPPPSPALPLPPSIPLFLPSTPLPFSPPSPSPSLAPPRFPSPAPSSATSCSNPTKPSSKPPRLSHSLSHSLSLPTLRLSAAHFPPLLGLCGSIPKIIDDENYTVTEDIDPPPIAATPLLPRNNTPFNNNNNNRISSPLGRSRSHRVHPFHMGPATTSGGEEKRDGMSRAPSPPTAPKAYRLPPPPLTAIGNRGLIVSPNKAKIRSQPLGFFPLGEGERERIMEDCSY